MLGDLGPGRFFSKPKARADTASQPVTPLHSGEPVGTSRRRGSSPDGGSQLARGPAPLPPWGLQLPPSLSSPTRVNFPVARPSGKKKGSGHPQAFVPSCQDQRPAQPRLAMPSLRRLLTTCSGVSFPFLGAPG